MNARMNLKGDAFDQWRANMIIEKKPQGEPQEIEIVRGPRRIADLTRRKSNA